MKSMMTNRPSRPIGMRRLGGPETRPPSNMCGPLAERERVLPWVHWVPQREDFRRYREDSGVQILRSLELDIRLVFTQAKNSDIFPAFLDNHRVKELS